jgi:hypothetical protein
MEVLVVGNAMLKEEQPKLEHTPACAEQDQEAKQSVREPVDLSKFFANPSKPLLRVLSNLAKC